jgi:hypothetical protein
MVLSACTLGTGEAKQGVAAFRAQVAEHAAVEEFTWKIQNGRPVLLGYHISSTRLVSE